LALLVLWDARAARESTGRCLRPSDLTPHDSVWEAIREKKAERAAREIAGAGRRAMSDLTPESLRLTEEEIKAAVEKMLEVRDAK
jgi:glutamine synthetase adenylyltransferase